MAELFGWLPAQSVPKKLTPRTRVVAFGDGYEQRQIDGINSQLSSYSLQFECDQETAEGIERFLKEKGGVTAFLFVPPTSWNPVLVVCDSGWERSTDGFNDVITTTFREVPA